MTLHAQQNKKENDLIQRILSTSPFLDSILKNKDSLGIKIIYTQIDRSKKGKAKFTDHSFNLESDSYFYPASTVKLPVAILAHNKFLEFP